MSFLRIRDDITVVIPTVGREILQQCLRSIAQGVSLPAQVIVVDQSSSPEVAGWIAAAAAEGLRATHLPSSQRGRASAVNRGIESTRTPFVAVTDDDCTVGDRWVQVLSERLVDDPLRIITGRVEAAGEEAVPSVVTSRQLSVLRKPRLSFDTLSGGNMGTAQEVFSKVGLLDEDPRLRFSEDGEFAYRALRANVPILYEPEAVVWHYGWREREKRAEQFSSYARSHGAFYGKYLRRGDWFLGVRASLHFARALRRWLRGVACGDQEAAMIGRSYVLGLVPGILSGLRRSELPSKGSRSSMDAPKQEPGVD